MKHTHNRKLAILGISLTQARLSNQSREALDFVRELIEKKMIETNFLVGASFSWVTLVIRYGIKHDEIPKYQRINKKYGDLPLAIEVDSNNLIESSLAELKLIFGKATLKALIHAGYKYDRPVADLEKMLLNLKGSFNPN